MSRQLCADGRNHPEKMQVGMPTRRQEKVARVVKEVVSDAIANHLNDPRIDGLVSVTRVEMAADMRIANVYLSIFGSSDTAQNKTFSAITHAEKRIQAILAGGMRCKFCPILRFFRDEQFKKTLEMMKLIDSAAAESRKKDLANGQED